MHKSGKEGTTGLKSNCVSRRESAVAGKYNSQRQCDQHLHRRWFSCVCLQQLLDYATWDSCRRESMHALMMWAAMDFKPQSCIPFRTCTSHHTMLSPSKCSLYAVV